MSWLVRVEIRALVRGLVSAIALAACAAFSAHAQNYRPVAIASFNLAWAGTVADYERHVAVCNAPEVNWCDSRINNRLNSRPNNRTSDRDGKGNTAELARAQRCQQATQAAAGGATAALLVAPCNAYQASGAQATRANYLQKLQGLRATVDQLISQDKVRVIAFQELRSKEALAEILGKHAAQFDVCVATHRAFQTLGFAWDKSLSSAPGVCTTYEPLGIPEPNAGGTLTRRMRPGLALALRVSGEPITFMNLHLKSACASLLNSRAFKGRTLDDPLDACETLNQQVAPLENWIEAIAKTSPRLVLLGDFNRRIDEEAAAAVAPAQVRTNGSNPAGPNPIDAQGKVATRYLWQELSDGSPTLHQLPLATDQPSTCKGFAGLDHMVISDALRQRQGTAVPNARKTGVQSQPQQVIQTSDHCPTVGVLKL